MLGACLGLLIAFSLKWIYFDLQGQPKRQHALQRDIHFGELWTALHWPLSMSITSSAAGLIGIEQDIVGGTEPSTTNAQSVLNDNSTIIHNVTDLTNNTNSIDTSSTLSSEWLFCISLGIALFCIAMHGLLSKEHHTRIVPHWIRVLVRIVLSIVVVVSPTFGLEELNLLGFVASLCFCCVVWEIVGTLPNFDDYYGKNKEEVGQSISSFLQQKQNNRMGVKQDGIIVTNATMRDGTLGIEQDRMTKRKGF